MLSDGTSATKIELLKILVLVASAGGVLSPMGSAGARISTAPVVAGTALLRAVLAVYRASLSEEDQVKVYSGGCLGVSDYPKRRCEVLRCLGPKI